jgi:hypothetical protein
MLEGVDYLDLYGSEPSAIENGYTIFTSLLKLDDGGNFTNLRHVEKRAIDSLRAYRDPS